MTTDSPSFVKFCSISGRPNVLTRCVVTCRPTCCFFFLHVSLTTRSTVEFFRIRAASGSSLSMLRTSDHNITNSITSKTMASAAPIVATRFENRDISAIPPMAVRARIRSVRARFLALLSDDDHQCITTRSILSLTVSRALSLQSIILSAPSGDKTERRGKERVRKRDKERERARIICSQRMDISKRASPPYLRIHP